VHPLPDRAERLFFLDWVRSLAFFVLIAYHVGMYYVSWDWVIKSPHASAGPEPFMLLSSPWRLTLLFFVAGAASRFMLERTGTGAFLRRRSVRLLVPLVFGMLTIVPVQPYLEVVDKVGYGGSYFDFMRLYLVGYDGFCREDCLILPTWNHLWFVAYLWVYTLVLALLYTLLGAARTARLGARVSAWLQGWKLFALPVVCLSVVRIALADRFPTTHALVDDWFNHAIYLPVFVLGALVARSAPLWQDMERLRRLALTLALVCWTLIVAWYAVPEDAFDARTMALIRLPMRCVYCLCTWSAIVAACGLARRHLNHDNAVRRYLTDAVFPVYIAHQSLIVLLAYAFRPLHLAPGLEAVLLMLLTLATSFALFEAVRRVALLRPLFGLAYAGPRGLARDAGRSANAL